MKKWIIWCSVGILLAVLLVVVAFVGRGGHEGLATKAEVQNLQGSVDKLTTSVGTLTGLIGEVNAKADKAVGKTTELENQQKLDLASIKSQATIAGLEKEAKDIAKAKDVEREISELKLKMAAAPVPVVQQYVLPQFVPSYPPPSAYRYGSFGINQTGRYSFVIEPYSATFSVDGQRVTNGQIIYLTAGWHNWTSDSEVSFRTSWVGY